MTHPLQIVKHIVSIIGHLGGGRIEDEKVVVTGSTLLNFGDGDYLLNIRRSFGHFRKLVLRKNSGKDSAESTKYWSNSKSSSTEYVIEKYTLEEKTSILQDEVCVRKNAVFKFVS